MQVGVINAAEVAACENRWIKVIVQRHCAHRGDTAHDRQLGTVDAAIASNSKRSIRENPNRTRAKRGARCGGHLDITTYDVGATGIGVARIGNHNAAHGAVNQFGDRAGTHNGPEELEGTTWAVTVGLKCCLTALDRGRASDSQPIKIAAAQGKCGVGHIEIPHLENVPLAPLGV